MGEAQTVPGAMRAFDAVELACDPGGSRDPGPHG